MAKRQIIEIDEDKCNGCTLCIPNCPEGAIQIIDNKARLISDLFCDGLGACINHCPEDAITIIEREAEPYDETKTMQNIIKHGPNTIKAHLQHLLDHNETKYYNEAINVLKKNNIKIPEVKPMQHSGCPGAALQDLRSKTNNISVEQETELRQWPIQLNLLPPTAPFFNDANLLIAADCTAFANPNFHSKLLRGKAIAIGCPKLDNIEKYKEKIKSIIEMNNLSTITVAIMEVPCCFSLYKITEDALSETGKRITLKKIVVGIDGTIRS